MSLSMEIEKIFVLKPIMATVRAQRQVLNILVARLSVVGILNLITISIYLREQRLTQMVA